MTEPYADLAARILRDARSHLAFPADHDSEADIAEIGLAIVRTARRARRRRVGLAVLAAAACSLVFGLLLHRWHAPTPVVSAPPAPQPAARASRWPMTIERRGAELLPDGQDDEVVTAGQRLETDALPLTLRAPDGTRLTLEPHSGMLMERGDAVARFRLVRGTVKAQVAKLSAGEQFLIETPDREIEVKGTRFSVHLASQPSCDLQTVTRVAVEEGTVLVRGPDGLGDLVRTGERWPGPCADDRTQTPGARNSAPRARTSHRPRSETGQSAAPSEEASTLAIENDLFSAAMRAKRAGEPGEAKRLLDRLIADYPTSPLRRAALDERAKLALPTPGRKAQQ